MSCYYVIGIRMDNQGQRSEIPGGAHQNGCMIKARLGLHEASEDVCANDGLIIPALRGKRRSGTAGEGFERP